MLRLLTCSLSIADTEDTLFVRGMTHGSEQPGYMPSGPDLERLAGIVQRIKGTMYDAPPHDHERAGQARELLAAGDVAAALEIAAGLADSALQAPLLAAIGAGQALLGQEDAAVTFGEALAHACHIFDPAARYEILQEVLENALMTPIAAQVFEEAAALARHLTGNDRDGMLAAISGLQMAEDRPGAEATARQIADPPTRLIALANNGAAAAGTDRDHAVALLEEVRQAAFQLPPGPGRDCLLHVLARHQGGVLADGAAALATAREIRDPPGRVHALIDIALIQAQADPPPALRCFAEALATAQGLRDAGERDFLLVQIVMAAGRSPLAREVASKAVTFPSFNPVTIARLQADFDLGDALATLGAIRDDRQRTLAFLTVAKAEFASLNRNRVYQAAVDSLAALPHGLIRQELERTIELARSRRRPEQE